MKEYAITETPSIMRQIPPIPSLQIRPRRNRKNAAIRSLTEETILTPQALIAPLFVIEGNRQRQSIPSLPHVYRLSIDLLIEEIMQLHTLGIRAIELFPVIEPSLKDSLGSEALRTKNLTYRAVESIKKAIPEMCVIVDIALDPFTNHGHDGLVDAEGNILNDETLIQLAQMALLLAEAGADIVAPSDMMDGRIGYIRQALDASGYTDVGILAYAAKYASALYGPFRDAVGSSLKFGDKKTYQLNPANRREALREIFLDESEGADLILIKPALAYLDIILKAKEQSKLPIGAYQVSGEYAMIMAAAKNGWVDGDRVLNECLLSIKRAGADFILSYGARRMAELLPNS